MRTRRALVFFLYKPYLSKLVMTERNTQMSDTISILNGFPIGQKFSQGLLKLLPLSQRWHRPAMGSGISDLFPPWITIIIC